MVRSLADRTFQLRSGQRWERGEVVQRVERDELDGPVIQVRYGDPPREKWLDAALAARNLKFVQ